MHTLSGLPGFNGRKPLVNQSIIDDHFPEGEPEEKTNGVEHDNDRDVVGLLDNDTELGIGHAQ